MFAVPSNNDSALRVGFISRKRLVYCAAQLDNFIVGEFNLHLSDVDIHEVQRMLFLQTIPDVSFILPPLPACIESAA